MARSLLSGSRLNEIAGSLTRWPGWAVLVWNPRETTINEVTAGSTRAAPLDLSPYVESIAYEENIGFENGNDPSVTRATFRFRRNPAGGKDLRRGLIEDGVIVRILQGDRRVRRDEWVPIFTGTFRGRPGDDKGTPSQLTEALEATAYGREERYLNLNVTTDAFEVDTDVGEIALSIATGAMGLGQDEIRFGAQGFRSKHLTNQVVDTNTLDALWQLFFVVGKKPKFDAEGKLVAVSVDLDKPAARVFSAGELTVEAAVATPNDVEVNNQVALTGLASVLSKVLQDSQKLFSVDVVTGFFDSEYKRTFHYSEDNSQRAQETFLVTKKKISFSDATWTERDEFSGVLEIDTHYLRNVRAIIFATYLALETTVAIIDLFLQGSGGAPAVLFSIFGINVTLAVLRFILHMLALVALAGLLWSMNFIGRGTYEVWGKPFEYAYKELVSKAQLVGLAPEEIRTAEFRNDLLATMADLDAISRAQLRRELVKNQTYTLSLMDDPLLEVDDVIELSTGERFYINGIHKDMKTDEKATVSITAWKIFDRKTAAIEGLGGRFVRPTGGYGDFYGDDYGNHL